MKEFIFLAVAENVLSILQNKEQKKIAQNAILDCWNWIETKEKEGDYFYGLLDHEDRGLVLFQESTYYKKEFYAWNCIIDAVAYFSKKAYEFNFFPQAIEIIDDTLIEHSIENFLKCNKNAACFIDNVIKICIDITDIKMLKKKLSQLF